MLAAMQQPALTMEDVQVAFGQQTVLSACSLRVAAGEKVCLRGASGSGKSTVLRCLLGLVIPRTGVIRIDDDLLTPRSVWPLRTRMAWAPQTPDWGRCTVREALCRPFSYRVNRTLPAPGPRMEAWLERFDLARSLLDQPTADLSGGEKQRLSLVAVLLLNRPILLIDEVTSALDPANRARVREALAELTGTTVLGVSHDAQAETWASRVIDLEAARA